MNQESILRFIKRAKNNRPTVVESVSDIESPAVIIYDPAEITQLKFLPVLFSQYPIYHIRDGQDFRVVLRQDNDTIYQG